MQSGQAGESEAKLISEALQGFSTKRGLTFNSKLSRKSQRGSERLPQFKGDRSGKTEQIIGGLCKLFYKHLNSHQYSSTLLFTQNYVVISGINNSNI